VQSVRALVVSCLRSSCTRISVLSGLHRRGSRVATTSFKREPGAHTETQELTIYCNTAVAVVTQGLHFFILGVIGTWLFSAVDACRTAQLMRAGLSPDAEDDVIARRLYGNPFAWGTTLIIIGTLFLLHTLLGVTLPIKELLPVALVGLGAYILFDLIKRKKGSDRIVRFDSRRPPPSVVATSRPVDTATLRTGETTQLPRRDVTPLPFERRS
jgi:hypothetical protein